MAAGQSQVIRCRCEKRHPLGTEWCPACGAYLPHDGTVVDAADTSPPPPEPVEGSGGTDGDAVEEGSAPSPEGAELTAPTPPPSYAGTYEPVELPEELGVSRGAAMIQETTPVAREPDWTDSYEPGATREQTVASTLDERPPGPNDRICPRDDCHLRNDPDRYFCRRCGTELLTDGQYLQAERLTWWGRLKAKLTGKSAKRGAGRAQHGVRRVRGLSTRARLFRTMIFGAAVGALGITFIPGLRTKVVGQVKDVTLVDRYSYVDVAGVTSTGEPVDGWEPALAADGTLNRAWAEPWTSAGEGFVVFAPDVACLEGPTIRLALAEPTDVDRARVWAGTWEDDEARGLHPRPRMLQVRTETEEGLGDVCTLTEIEDDPAPQNVAVGGQDVTAILLTVVGVYPGDPSTPLVAISEVWLEKDR